MKKAFLQLHAAVFLAGFTGILGKLIQLGEGMLVWWRIFITIVVLLVWMAATKQLEILKRKDIAPVAGVGLLIALHWIFFYGSIKYSNVSVALVCFSATGFFTAILEPLVLRKRIVWVELALGLLSIIGIYIIFDFHPQYKLGIIFGILAAIGSALFPIFNKQLLGRINASTLTLYEFIGGLLLLSFILPMYHQFFPANYYWPTNMDWIWLLILAIACTAFMFILQLQALKKVSAFTSNLSFNLEPLYGIIMAFIFFKEGQLLKKQFFIGLGLIVLAVLLQTWLMWRKSRTSGVNSQ